MGFDRYDFSAKGVRVEPLNICASNVKLLEENLLLLFTGFTRFSDKISRQNEANIPLNIATLEKMKAMTDLAQRLLQHGALDDFGKLLGESWKMKKTLADEISNRLIDEIYQIALDNGALGGKLLGAGGGGFLLLYVPKCRQVQVKQALSNEQFTPIRFEKIGSRIIN